MSMHCKIWSGVTLLLALAQSVANGTDYEAFGRALYFDSDLSATGNQSCATCHEPGRAFSDSRDHGVGGAVSVGDDGTSLGDRNTPATTYAWLVPPFHVDQQGEFVGGLFLDGRAATLEEQALEPFVNPIEMNLPDHAALVAKIRSNSGHVRWLELFGKTAAGDPPRDLQIVTAAIAEFQRGELFGAFDSKYDRYLDGKYEMTTDEELGRVLFFSQLVNCSSCHLLDRREFSAREVFSNYRYHNIGVPVNAGVRAVNGVDREYRDPGLYGNPAVDDPAMMGKFRVPSLRNVAVTAPYMHNGVFRELRTAILFYNRFMLGDDRSQTNPETGKFWAPPEVPDTVDLELLREGQPLAGNHVVALEAFLRTLTDRHYEHLLEPGLPR